MVCRKMQPPHHAYIHVYVYVYFAYTYVYVNHLCGRNETAGRKRQSTAASMRKPRRNDTRAGANWALEVTLSRGMLFHPRTPDQTPSTRSSCRPSALPLSQQPLSAFSFSFFLLFMHRESVWYKREGSRRPYHRKDEVRRIQVSNCSFRTFLSEK